jgi:hypothetical protein
VALLASVQHAATSMESVPHSSPAATLPSLLHDSFAPAALAPLQMASAAGAVALVEEGAARAYQLLAPLLALRRPPACLIKPLSQLLLCLRPVMPAQATACRQVGQLQQHQAAARVAAAASCHLLRLAVREGELQLAQQVARMDLPLLLADSNAPSCSSGLAAPLPEVMALQEAALLLLGPPQQSAAPPTAPAAPGRPATPAAAAAAGGAAAEDLASLVLPLLASADPMDACWPVLSSPVFQSHPRWLELCVRVAEAAVRKRAAGGLQPLLEAVTERARQGLQLPRIEWSAQRWTVAAAAAQVQVVVPDAQLPARPEMQGVAEERAQQALAQWQEQCRELQAQVGVGRQLRHWSCRATLTRCLSLRLAPTASLQLSPALALLPRRSSGAWQQPCCCSGACPRCWLAGGQCWRRVLGVPPCCPGSHAYTPCWPWMRCWRRARSHQAMLQRRWRRCSTLGGRLSWA